MGVKEVLENFLAQDEELFLIYQKELKRQKETLTLIPSENYPSLKVLLAQATVFGNKYAEGYPQKRYYAGNQFIDELETLAIERAKALFKVPFANVQALSGSPANLAVYLALIEPGEKIMGLDLDSGGHLTHGAKSSFTSKLFQSIPYKVDSEGFLDLNYVEKLAKKEKPKIIIVGTTAYPRILDFKAFSEIAEKVGAYLLADISHIAGLVVAGAHPSPVPFADIITTTTHKTLRGPRGALILVTERGIQKDKDLPKKINKAIFPGLQGGPHQNTIFAIALALKEAQSKEFKDYSFQIIKNSKVLAQTLIEEGIKLVTNGTDNHLMVLEFRENPGFGSILQEALEEIGLTANKNTIPQEPFSPFFPSGLRIGTPAITSRKMQEKESKEVGKIIAKVIEKVKNFKLYPNHPKESLKEIKAKLKNIPELKDLKFKVKELALKFPIYPEL